MKLQLEVAAKTDVGLKRKNNEDNFGFDTSLGVFVLCDGMGGQAAGEVASRLSVQCIMDYFRESKRLGHFPIPKQIAERELSELSKAVATSLDLANRAVWDAASRGPAQGGMGSTVVVLLVSDDQVVVGHAGDSRAYLFREGNLQRLTTDHSLVEEQLRRGLITPQEAERSRFKNIVLRASAFRRSSKVKFTNLRLNPMMCFCCPVMESRSSFWKIRSSQS